MMYLLDTNVISELRKAEKGRADAQVMQWFAHIQSQQAYVSVISLAEIQIGILLLARRDSQAATTLQDWLEARLLPEFANRILPLDSRAALLSAQFHIPDKSPLNDAYIAATAKAHGLTLVTRNVRDFEGLGIEVFNPFAAAG
ncbi:type II toxin-antitoxin system VapC family toxin [Allofranklinella schreckenbergeri]|nr:type II toxin-antitoxin system VapC family toxin [Allofranklinella schreckenbergeri]